MIRRGKHAEPAVMSDQALEATERASGAGSQPPAKQRSTPRLCFLGPLDELVSLGLYQPTLAALCRGDVGDMASPIDRSYLRKILHEEVARQFGHPLRPLVELVLNAVDAASGERACRVVTVTVEEQSVTVADSGSGMSIAVILSKLLVPFATDKIAGVDLGRFGIGFFSALAFGLADPTSFSLKVDTSDGSAGFSVCVSAAGHETTDLMVSIRATAVQRGTRVKLTSALLDAARARSYLRDMLHLLPPERAVVRLDGVPINDGSLLSGGRLYEERIEGSSSIGRFHFGGRGLTPGITAATYHAGVKVESCFALGELLLLDFPAAVELTQSRDAMKPGPMFAAAARAFYRRLIAIGADAAGVAEAMGAPPTESAVARRHWIAELAAQISALMLREAAFSEVAQEIADALIGRDRFLVSADRVEALVGFLGAASADRLFSPVSFWAERQWQPFLPDERDLLEDELVIDPPQRLAALAQKRPDLAGLSVLVARSSKPEAVSVALARGRRGTPPGPMPCFGSQHGILLHEDNRSMRAPLGWRDLYALQTAFDRARGLRESDVERALIISAPLGQERLNRPTRPPAGAARKGETA